MFVLDFQKAFGNRSSSVFGSFVKCRQRSSGRSSSVVRGRQVVRQVSSGRLSSVVRSFVKCRRMSSGFRSTAFTWTRFFIRSTLLSCPWITAFVCHSSSCSLLGIASAYFAQNGHRYLLRCRPSFLMKRVSGAPARTFRLRLP